MNPEQERDALIRELVERGKDLDTLKAALAIATEGPTRVMHAEHVKEFLAGLLLDVGLGQVVGIALVVQRTNGVVTTWQTQAQRGVADRFKLLGGLTTLQHRLAADIEAD